MLRRAALVLSVVLPVTMPVASAGAQGITPGERVRVTVQRAGVTSRETGWLMFVTPDTVGVQLSRQQSLRVARTDVARLERRRRNVSIGKAMGLGCLAGGAALGGLGIVSHDPDSPGIEQTLAVVGLMVGCVGGGAVGLVGGVAARGPWEDVALEAVLGSPPSQRVPASGPDV